MKQLDWFFLYVYFYISFNFSIKTFVSACMNVKVMSVQVIFKGNTSTEIYEFVKPLKILGKKNR